MKSQPEIKFDLASMPVNEETLGALEMFVDKHYEELDNGLLTFYKYCGTIICNQLKMGLISAMSVIMEHANALIENGQAPEEVQAFEVRGRPAFTSATEAWIAGVNAAHGSKNILGFGIAGLSYSMRKANGADYMRAQANNPSRDTSLFLYNMIALTTTCQGHPITSEFLLNAPLMVVADLINKFNSFNELD